MDTNTIEWVLLIKTGYAMCGGIGAVLAVAMNPVKTSIALGRGGAGIGLCFLFAEPLRVYFNLPSDPHTHIGINGAFGFASWYCIGGLDRLFRNAFNGDSLASTLGILVRAKLGLPMVPPPVLPPRDTVAPTPSPVTTKEPKP